MKSIRLMSKIFIPATLMIFVGSSAFAFDFKETKEKTEKSSVICGKVLVANNGTFAEQDEAYEFGTLSAYLETDTEFAAYLGLSSVASCEDARRFAVAYRTHTKSSGKGDTPSISQDEEARQSAPPTRILAQNLFELGPSGGYNGNSHTDIDILRSVSDLMRLSTVDLYCGWFRGVYIVMGIQGRLSNGASLNLHGKTTNDHTPCDIPKGVSVTKVTGRYGEYVDRVTFHLSNGIKCGCGGYGGGDDYKYTFPSGELMGFFTDSWGAVDAIGFILKR